MNIFSGKQTFIPTFMNRSNRATTPVSIPASLTFENISHHYTALPAVKNISFDIPQGEIVALLGRSGCGKSTILRIAAGLLEPRLGRVAIGGQDVVSQKIFIPAEKRNIGLMFQDYALFPHMTILQNIMFGLRALSKKDAKAEARRALERVGLADKEKAYPHMLSGGEQQRIALARTVAPRPGILLFDEPFSGLDKQLRLQIRTETLKVIRETRATSIIVTHDPEEAMRVANRIILMRKGEIAQQGEPQHLYENPNSLYAARFFCELNEIKAQVSQGRIETPIGLFSAGDRKEGEHVIVCFRPHSVSITPSGYCLPAKVKSRQFIGELDNLEIIINGLDTPITARLRAPDHAQPKSEIGIEVNKQDVMIFSADDEN